MKRLPILLMLLVTSLFTGCQSESDRVSRLAEQALHQQSQQNEEMARLNREVTAATERLVEADAEARQEILSAHRSLVQQRDALEHERRDIASDRVRESLLAPLLWHLGTLVLCLIPAAVALLVLRQHSTDETGFVNEILIEELTAEHPRLLGPSTARLAAPSDNTSSSEGSC
jgi:hypothetical protein